mmetsp:Transcript_17088/g.23771  ORF Transcript_17088/g.23771 Transcript_17088/m.23771 type:complete len:369 (-) Transcript_17088:26-1132(-)
MFCWKGSTNKRPKIQHTGLSSKDDREYIQIKNVASLNVVWGIAYDKSRKVTYVTSSQQITKIIEDGKQTEMKVNPSSVHTISYVALSRDGRTLYFSETSANRIQKSDLGTGTVQVVAGCDIGRKDGLCSVAAFHQPLGIALDHTEQNLFVCDSGNNCIRKIDLLNNSVSTVVGRTKGNQDGHFDLATFYLPHGLCFDSKQNLFVSEYLGTRIRYLDFENKQVITFLGSCVGDWIDGLSEDATVVKPSGLFYDYSSQSLWFADSCRIRKFDLQSRIVTTIAGTYSAENSWVAASFSSNPKCICMDHSRNVLITDTTTGRVWKLLYNKKKDWKNIRVLWIGHLKNTPETCNLAKLPPEMVAAICNLVVRY